MQESDKYLTYLDERRSLVEGEKEVAARFDKSVLTLSGGALLLSITFFKEIVRSPAYIWMMIIAWLAFGLTIVTMLVSLITSQNAYRRQRDILDGTVTSSEEDDQKNRSAFWTQVLNFASVCIFIIGVVFFASFVLYNTKMVSE